MIWSDSGFLLSKVRYNENSLICEFFTKDHGKSTGIVFGGTSKKIKNYLQIGNKFFINYTAKTDNRIGNFKVEIERALSPLYFDEKHKLSCIICAMQMIKLLNADSQRNYDVFQLIDNFYNILESTDWLTKYIFWELELFKILGYDLEFKSLANKILKDRKVIYVSKSNVEKKIIPNFLIDKSQKPDNFNNLLEGLKLVGEYLEKSILRPNNLSLPLNRINFINLLKSSKFH